jgi:putative hydrolase of the HAD superfamily
VSAPAGDRRPVKAVIFDDPFHRAFLSAELGLRKPDRAIFQRALAELGCEPAEAVLTDDNLDNATGARVAGMHPIHYRDFDAFAKELAQLIEPGP